MSLTAASRWLVGGVAVASALLLGVGCLPLFSRPGYEYSLAAGLVLPSLAALSVAGNWQQTRPTIAQAYRSVWRFGIAFGLAGYGVALLHGVRTGLCDWRLGSLHYGLGPGVGAIMGALGGWLAAEIWGYGAGQRRRLWLWLLCFAGPVGGILVSAGRFYTSPMIFAFDPFFGFFSGTLYDTVIDEAGRLGTYRLGSAMTLLAFGVLSQLARRTDEGRWILARAASPELLALGCVSALASVSHSAFGAKLGHWQTVGSIERALGRRIVSDRCEVVFSRRYSRKRANLFAKDCDDNVRANEAYLKMRYPKKIRAYLFRDVDQKRRLMGAAHTYIAKPWRGEVYLQPRGYPHAVLGHELAHVMGAHWAHGPFAIPGSLGGLIPDPGLVEGFAVATSPDDDDLSPKAWSRAMLELKLLPPVGSIFSLGFLKNNSSLSYTVAGAFVDWVVSTRGIKTLRRWYGGESLTKLTGRSWKELDGDFRSFLGTQPLAPAALAIAKVRFDRPAIFGRRCPHLVDALKQRAREALAEDDAQGALELLARLFELAPRDQRARGVEVRCLRSQNKEKKAIAVMEREMGHYPKKSRIRQHYLETQADYALARGEYEKAEKAYAQLLQKEVYEDRLRTLDIKRQAAQEKGLYADAIVELLIGRPGIGRNAGRASELLARAAVAKRKDGVPGYLLGRKEYNRANFKRAQTLLAASLKRRFASQRVEREAARLAVLSSCVIGDQKSAKSWLKRWRKTKPAQNQRGKLLENIVAHCGKGASPAKPQPKEKQ